VEDINIEHDQAGFVHGYPTFESGHKLHHLLISLGSVVASPMSSFILLLAGVAAAWYFRKNTRT